MFPFTLNDLNSESFRPALVRGLSFAVEIKLENLRAIGVKGGVNDARKTFKNEMNFESVQCSASSL